MEVKADAGSDVEITAGESVTLTAGGGDRYEWSTGETTRSITVSPSSTQRYKVTAFQGECQDMDEVLIQLVDKENNEVTSNDESIRDELTLDYTIFPNPASDYLNISLVDHEISEVSLLLIAQDGKQVYSNNLEVIDSFANDRINVSRFTKGIYFLKIYHDQQVVNKKVVVI
jgi:hypothetical protein